MNLVRLRSHVNQRFACLLALVLLLPIAQTFAALHQISHVQTVETDRADTAHLVGPGFCDICLASMSVTGGAPPSAARDYLELTVGVTVPPVTPVDAFRAVATQAYQSRAPPFTRI